MQEKVKSLYAYHSVQYTVATTGNFPPAGEGVRYGYHGDAFLRPLVKMHPVTGRPALLVPRHAFGVVGMRPEESEKLIHELISHIAQPGRVYEHEWKLGDLVVWDQRRCMHRARPFDPAEVRTVRGTRIAGDPKTEAALEPATLWAPKGTEIFQAEITRLRAKPVGALNRHGFEDFMQQVWWKPVAAGAAPRAAL